MKIVLAGGSGFLGRALEAYLAAEGHGVRVLTRRPRPGRPADVAWSPGILDAPWVDVIADADVVINLAGEGIADRRWSPARKAALLDSRLAATRAIAAAIERAPSPPVLVSGSAIGYYGARGEEPLTEAAPPGSDFLARLSSDWEREAERAERVTRVAIVRSGVVLHRSGGALAKMLPAFKLGLGGPLGSGRQYMSWIHLTDWVRLVAWIAAEPHASGPFNATAPVPVTNAEFTRALGRFLRRPAVVPVPAFALRLLFGEVADSLLTGQRVLPARAERLGFEFTFPRLDTALADLI